MAFETVDVCGSDMHAYLGHDSRHVPQLNRRYEAYGRASALGDVLEGRCAPGRIVLIP